MYKEKIDAYMEAHKQELIEDACKLIAIPSDKGEEEPGLPFGEGPARCLKEALDIAEAMGFQTKNYDNYVGCIDLTNGERALDILAHLDVVPASDAWTITAPFSPVVKDNKLFGRGAADDKGPAIAALYALRAIKDLGIPVTKNVRLILGTDEECGSSDIEYYYKQEKEAPMTFSPDAEFPVINIEKGGLRAVFKGEYREENELPQIRSIKGGFKLNAVPDTAIAVIAGFREEEVRAYLNQAEKKTGVTFQTEKNEETICIHAKGKAAHAASPENGNNAITALVSALVSMPFARTEAFNRLCSLNSVFPHGDYLGRAAGIAMEDELSGHLTISFDLFEYNTKGFTGEADCRAPICANNENLRDVLRKKLAAGNILLSDRSVYPAHHVREDSPFVQILLKAYEEYTGKQGKCLAIGGSSYVHDLKNGVAFGCADLEVDNHMHGDDEYIHLDTLLMSAKLFADVIIRLCQ